MSTIHDDATDTPIGNSDEQPAQAPPPTMTFARGLMSVGMAVIFLALLAAAAAGMWYWQTRPQRGAAVKILKTETEIDPNAVDRPRLTSFELTDQEGRPFDSKSMEGKIWVVNFFFATCNQTCRQLSEQVQKLAGDYAGKGVRFISITVDPERDTPEVLAEYAKVFNAQSDQWRFLTGDQKLIERIGADIFLAATGSPQHSNEVFIVGPDGKVAGRYNVLDPYQLQLARGTLNSLLKRQRQQRAEQSQAGPRPDKQENGHQPMETDSDQPTSANSADQPAEGR